MRIAGKPLATGIAKPANGVSAIVYEIVHPASTPENLAHLVSETARWKQQAESFQSLDAELARRARFGIEVMQSAATVMQLGACCLALAQDDAGSILAVASYGMFPPDGYLHLQVIEPRHLAGSPGSAQLRGLGTALTASISRQMLKGGVETVYLHPLDSAAASFWTGRGFGVCGRGGLMCIRGREGVEKLIGGCIARPDLPDRGELICCGPPSAGRAALPYMLGAPSRGF